MPPFTLEKLSPSWEQNDRIPYNTPGFVGMTKQSRNTITIADRFDPIEN